MNNPPFNRIRYVVKVTWDALLTYPKNMLDSVAMSKHIKETIGEDHTVRSVALALKDLKSYGYLSRDRPYIDSGYVYYITEKLHEAKLNVLGVC